MTVHQYSPRCYRFVVLSGLILLTYFSAATTAIDFQNSSQPVFGDKLATLISNSTSVALVPEHGYDSEDIADGDFRVEGRDEARGATTEAIDELIASSKTPVEVLKYLGVNTKNALLCDKLGSWYYYIMKLHGGANPYDHLVEAFSDKKVGEVVRNHFEDGKFINLKPNAIKEGSSGLKIMDGSAGRKIMEDTFAHKTMANFLGAAIKKWKRHGKTANDVKELIGYDNMSDAWKEIVKDTIESLAQEFDARGQTSGVKKRKRNW